MGDAEFSHWLELPAGTAFVKFADLAHLIARALHPAPPDDVDSDFTYGGARINLERELPEAVHAGALKVRDPLTHGPHPFPHGDALQRGAVKVSDLQAYIADRDIGVRFAAPTKASAVPAEGAPIDGDRDGGAMTRYELPQFARLEPRTPWRGGRVADTDLLTLEEASSMASKHAGMEVTVRDFLLAAARGEILLRCVCPRDVTMQPVRESDKPLDMPETSIPTLPIDACRALSNVGRAKWRTVESHEPVPHMGEVLGRFTRWRLPDDEPAFDTLPQDCRVTGHDVHALADAFVEQSAKGDEVPAEPAGAIAPEAGETPAKPNAQDGRKRWTPERLEELRQYRAKRGTKGAAAWAGVSEARVRELLPSDKQQPKPYSVFNPGRK